MANPADLNTLLRWATENTPATRTNPPYNERTLSELYTGGAVGSDSADGGAAPMADRNDSLPPMQLTFRPAPDSTLSVLPSPPPKKLDTGVLDAIMGRSDAVRIREAMQVFEDPSQPLAEREVAGEELQDLVEDLDNANDLEALGMWPRLMQTLVSPEDRIRFHSCWIIGNAVQNNAKSQAAFLRRNPLPHILDLISNPPSQETQSKATYLLSATIQHAPPSTFETFTALQGYQILANTLCCPSLDARRKTAFLLNNLAIQNECLTSISPMTPMYATLDEGYDRIAKFLNLLESQGVWDKLVESLSPSRAFPTGLHGDAPSQDEDYNDKALRALATIILLPNAASTLSAQAKSTARSLIVELKTTTTTSSSSSAVEAWKQRLNGAGIGKSEWIAVEKVLQEQSQ